MAVRSVVLSVLLTGTLSACGGGPYSDEADYDSSYPVYSGSSTDQADEDEQIEDGSYPATVDYYNPRTGYSSTYDLDVEVADGEVVTVYFPKGGSVSGSAELDEDGRATLYGDDGEEYSITVEP